MNAPSSMTLVSLLAGRRKFLPQWETWLLEATFPLATRIVLVDNSGDQEFAATIRSFARRLWERPEVSAVSFRAEGKRYSPAEGESYFEMGRHVHVANLYQEIFPTLTGDLYFTLEDDVIPPKDALTRMIEDVWMPNEKVGAVAGAYSMPTSKAHITAATVGDKWSMGIISWNDLPKGPMRVGFTGGGCTLWNAAAISDTLPIRAYMDPNEGIRGWDNNLSRSLTTNGHEIYVHGGVRCKHLTVDDTSKREDGW